MAFGGGGGVGGRGLGLGKNDWKLTELAKEEHWDLKIILRALSSFQPYSLRVLGIACLLLVTSVLGIVPPLLTRMLIDKGISQGNVRILLMLTIAVIGTSLISGLLDILQNWLNNSVGQRVMADFRLRLFSHMHQQSMQFFTKNRSGDLVSRVMNDVSAIQGVVTGTFVGMLTNIFTIISTVYVMFTLNWKLSLLSLVVVPAFIIPARRVGRRRQELQQKIQQSMGILTGHLAETFGVSGALLVKVFTREKEEEERFNKVNSEIRNLQIRQGLVGRWLFMWLRLFSSVGPALLWGYGGYLVIRHELSLGSIVAFVALLNRLYAPLSQLVQLHVNVLASVALFRRIFDLLDLAPDIVSGPMQLEREQADQEICLDHVYFSYSAKEPGEHRQTLTDIHLRIDPGSLVALVGPSGAGKTTLTNLILRLHDPEQGSITWGGTDIRQFQLNSLREQIGLVPQEPFLFHDTIYNNLLYSKKEATRDEIIDACKAAQIDDVIREMPDGYETMVGERGHRLSGGEKQRIAIARILIRSPKVVLLDEATSSLDSVNERLIQDALAKLLQGRTSIVIAHRLSTILNADRIVVMEHGRIAATGTHDELLHHNILYQRLYHEQFLTDEAEIREAPETIYRSCPVNLE